MLATAWPFIEFNDRGRPCIRGTGVKVLLLIQQHAQFGWDAGQLHRQYPRLTLPQIHSALGFYYDHQDECDRMIADDERQIDQMLPALENAALQSRLRRLKEGS